MTYRTESEHWAVEREHVARRSEHRADTVMLWVAVIAVPVVMLAVWALKFVGVER